MSPRVPRGREPEGGHPAVGTEASSRRQCLLAGQRAASAPGSHCKVQAVPGHTGAQRAASTAPTPLGGLPGRDQPVPGAAGAVRGRERAGISARLWQLEEYSPSPLGKGRLTAPDRLCQRLFAQGLCLPHLPRDRGLFQPLSSPSTPRSCPLTHLDLILQALGSAHQGLDLVGRETNELKRTSCHGRLGNLPSSFCRQLNLSCTRSLWSQATGNSRVSQGWHSPPHGAAPAAAPPAPLQGKCAMG